MYNVKAVDFTLSSLNLFSQFRPTEKMMFCWPVLVTANAPMFIPSKYLDKLNNGDDLDEQVVEDRFISKFFISDTCITTISITMKTAGFISMIAAEMADICPPKTCDVGHCLFTDGSSSTGRLVVGSSGDIDVLQEAAKFNRY